MLWRSCIPSVVSRHTHFFKCLNFFFLSFLLVDRRQLFFIYWPCIQRLLNLLQGLNEIMGKPPAHCQSLPAPICVPKMRQVRDSLLSVRLVRGWGHQVGKGSELSRAVFAGPIEGRWIHMERNNTRTIRKLPCNFFWLFIGYSGSLLLHASFSLVMVNWGYSLGAVLRPCTGMARCRVQVLTRSGLSSCGMRVQ